MKQKISMLLLMFCCSCGANKSEIKDVPPPSPPANKCTPEQASQIKSVSDLLAEVMKLDKEVESHLSTNYGKIPSNDHKKIKNEHGKLQKTHTKLKEEDTLKNEMCILNEKSVGTKEDLEMITNKLATIADVLKKNTK